ncbi:MAG: class I SAM-dependent methyltransferase [Gammaproteobacteria bacterium]
MAEASGVWRQQARQWSLLGPPLRPAAVDVDFVRRAATRWVRRHGRAPRVLLLGVTPELAGLAWPSGTTLLALDRAVPMIAGVWPGDRAWRHAVCADWRTPPLASSSRDLVVGDGALNALPVSAWPAMLDALATILAPGGEMVLRAFLRPDIAESTAAVFADLQAGRIGSFHVFKWRLAMSLHGDLERGVVLDRVWRAWQAEVTDPAGIAAARGWSMETVATIDAYRDSPTRLSFPTHRELLERLGPFACAWEERPHYELGARCPTFLLCPR